MSNIAFGLLNEIAEVDHPAGYNGRRGNVSITGVTTHIQDHHVIVVTRTYQMSLRDTIAYILWVCNGAPGAPVVVTDAMVAACKIDICHAILKYEFFGIFFDFSVTMQFRKSDIMMVDTFMLNPAAEGFVVAANKILTYLNAHPAMYSKCCSDAPFLPMLLILNALHRHENEGHNFFTNMVLEPGTSQHRLMGVAASNGEAFEKFIQTRNAGHDFFHLLTDECLRSMCDALTGVTNPATPDHFDYNGQRYVCNGVGNRPSLAHIIKLGNGMTDRYPPGVVGVAAIYLLMLLATMFHSNVVFRVTQIKDFVARKIDVGAAQAEVDAIVAENTAAHDAYIASLNDEMDGFSDVASVAGDLKAAMEGKDFPRDTLLELKEKLGPFAAFLYGFSEHFPDMKKKATKSESFKTLANNSSYESRISVGRVVGEFVANREVIEIRAVKELMSCMRNMFKALTEAAATIKEDGVDRVEGDDVPGDYTVVPIPPDDDDEDGDGDDLPLGGEGGGDGGGGGGGGAGGGFPPGGNNDGDGDDDEDDDDDNGGGGGNLGIITNPGVLDLVVGAFGEGKVGTPTGRVALAALNIIANDPGVIGTTPNVDTPNNSAAKNRANGRSNSKKAGK